MYRGIGSEHKMTKGGSLGLPEPPFRTPVFHFCGEFGQKIKNYHATDLKLPLTNPLSGNFGSDYDYKQFKVHNFR